MGVEGEMVLPFFRWDVGGGTFSSSSSSGGTMDGLDCVLGAGWDLVSGLSLSSDSSSQSEMSS